MKNIIVSIFPKPSDAEICLTNLSEAEIPANTISVIAQDTDIIDALGKYTGLFSTVSFAELPGQLFLFGISKESSTLLLQLIKEGAVCICVESNENEVELVKEMFTDAHGQHILTIFDPSTA